MFEEKMRKKEDRELLDILFMKEKYQPKAYEAAILEVKKRGLKVKWDEIDAYNAQTKKEMLHKDEKDCKQKREDILIGLSFLALGAVLSFLTYFTTLPGGTYIIFSGFIAVGIYRIFR